MLSKDMMEYKIRATTRVQIKIMPKQAFVVTSTSDEI